jgi:RNA-binding motif X-linked protein 2
MNKIAQIERLNELEMKQGLTSKASWHDDFKDTCWVYAGGLPYELTEGDLIAIFSQWGEIVDLTLNRDKDTGKSKGFAFIAYANQKSTILAVDNFNGIEILGRKISIDHSRYNKTEEDDETKKKVLPLAFDPNNIDNEFTDPLQKHPKEDIIDINDPMLEFLRKDREKERSRISKKAKKEKKEKKKEKKDKKHLRRE